MATLKQIVAPLTGTIVEVRVTNGQKVAKGELLALMESMKVQLRVEAEHQGKVSGLNVQAGATVERGSNLLLLEVDPDQSSATIAGVQDASPHPLIREFKARQALSLDSHRQQALDQRHAKGYLSARENLANLCDPKDFQEYGQFAVAAQRQRQDYERLKTTTAADGIITGIGQINDLPTALVINDYSVLAGTQGFYHHAKLDRILGIAEQKSLPIIMYTEGGGGRPGDTDVSTVNSGLQCTSFSTWARLSGKVPRIAVANGYNFAGNAALFGAADITIATKTSWIGMAGPAMIEGGGLGQFKPTDIGPIETQVRNGTVDIVVDNEAHAAQTATKVLGFLQGVEHVQWQSHDQSTLQSALPENRRQTYSVRSIIEQISDQDSFCELRALFGQSIVTGFSHIEGKAVGLIANDCQHLGGAIDVDSGEKAARFIGLCDQFKIPIISLCDTPGFMVGPQHEQLGAVRRLAELFRAGALVETPFYAVVLRKCYGLGAQAMLGGHSHRPLYTLSWPSGEFGPMGLEGAVKLGFKKELAAVTDPTKQQALFDKLLAEQYLRGQASEVASVLEIDAVIDPSDTRSVLASLLNSKH